MKKTPCIIHGMLQAMPDVNPGLSIKSPSDLGGQCKGSQTDMEREGNSRSSGFPTHRPCVRLC